MGKLLDTYPIPAVPEPPTYSTPYHPPNPPQPPRRDTHTQHQGVIGGDITNDMVYHSSYDETMWRALRDKAGPMRDILKCASGLVSTPPRPPAMHIKSPAHHTTLRGYATIDARERGVM